jgi:hypothetical protein
MNELGSIERYTIKFRNMETINELGHNDGFVTEIFVYDSSETLLLYGEGWGKKLNGKPNFNKPKTPKFPLAFQFWTNI